MVVQKESRILLLVMEVSEEHEGSSERRMHRPPRCLPPAYYRMQAALKHHQMVLREKPSSFDGAAVFMGYENGLHGVGTPCQKHGVGRRRRPFLPGRMKRRGKQASPLACGITPPFREGIQCDHQGIEWEGSPPALGDATGCGRTPLAKLGFGRQKRLGFALQSTACLPPKEAALMIQKFFATMFRAFGAGVCDAKARVSCTDSAFGVNAFSHLSAIADGWILVNESRDFVERCCAAL